MILLYKIPSYNHAMIHGEEPGSTQWEIKNNFLYLLIVPCFVVLDPNKHSYYKRNGYSVYIYMYKRP